MPDEHSKAAQSRTLDEIKATGAAWVAESELARLVAIYWTRSMPDARSKAAGLFRRFAPRLGTKGVFCPRARYRSYLKDSE